MKLLTFLQLTEARDRLSMNDAIDIVREIETGRGGIAELMKKKPYFKEMSQAKLRSEYGDVVPLFRVLSIPEGKERRPDGIVSTTTDWKVAYAMGRDLPGVMMGKNGFISMQKVLLRYDVPVEQCLADVNMLLEMVVDALGGFEKIGNQQLRGRSGPVAVSLLIKEGMKEDEVIADVTGLESVVLEVGSHVSGRQEMEMIRGLDAGDYDSPEEYMAHRIANKGSNEFFSPEEMEELKAMYGNKAPDVKRA